MKVNNELDRSLLAKQAAQSRNHILAVLTAILGSAVLLAANVIVEDRCATDRRGGAGDCDGTGDSARRPAGKLRTALNAPEENNAPWQQLPTSRTASS